MIRSIIIALIAGLILVGLAACEGFNLDVVTPTDKPTSTQSDSKEMSARLPVPVVQVEATVVKLSKDPPEKQCDQKCVYNIEDTGTILVNRVLAVQSSPQELASHDPGDISKIEGTKIAVQFRYSHRPAKVNLIPDSEASDGAVSNGGTGHTSPGAVIKKNGYYIYEVKTGSVDKFTQIVLPGLNAGDTIRTEVTFYSPSRGAPSQAEGMISLYETLR